MSLGPSSVVYKNNFINDRLDEIERTQALILEALYGGLHAMHIETENKVKERMYSIRDRLGEKK